MASNLVAIISWAAVVSRYAIWKWPSGVRVGQDRPESLSYIWTGASCETQEPVPRCTLVAWPAYATHPSR